MMHDSPVHEMLGSTENLVAAARKRLELWDISDRADRRRSSQTGQPVKYLTSVRAHLRLRDGAQRVRETANHAGHRALQHRRPLHRVGGGRRLRIRGVQRPHRAVRRAHAGLSAGPHLSRARQLHSADNRPGDAHRQSAHRVPQSRVPAQARDVRRSGISDRRHAPPGGAARPRCSTRAITRRFSWIAATATSNRATSRSGRRTAAARKSSAA